MLNFIVLKCSGIIAIYPWLATIPSIQPFVMNTSEVTDVLSLPMNDVICSKNYRKIAIQRYGKTVVSCQYTASKQLVWGATARIMKQLCIQEGLR